MAWALFEERFGVCLSPTWFSLGGQAGAPALRDWISFPKVSTRMQH